MRNNQCLVEMKNINKYFGGVWALKNINIKIGYGEVIGLLGDNGAGKSTLVKIIMGLFPPDEGKIYFEGKEVRFSSPAEARDRGIEIVYQTLELIDLMNIQQNFFLGKELRKKVGPFNFLDKKKMDLETTKSLNQMGIKIRSSRESVSILSGGERQSICIGRSIYFGSKLLLLDEPTAALSIKETDKVLGYIKKAKKEGMSVVFITHNVYHAYPVCDRFIILNRGVKLGDFSKKDVTPENLIEMIASGQILPRFSKQHM